jgi:methylated-DNA-[protein]-cysteine S-methyltransferase
VSDRDACDGVRPPLLPRPDEMPLPDLALPADAAGVLDLAYTIERTPLGELLLAATTRGLVQISFLDDGAHSADAALSELARRISPRILADPRRLDPARRELEEFFSGRRRRFEAPQDWRLIGGFARRVLRATARIPYGELSTYGGVARSVGSPRAYRAVGNALGSNPLPIVVPCHRVVREGGRLGGYGGGLERKRTLLALEGAPVEDR